jgi:hypothetical protein
LQFTWVISGGNNYDTGQHSDPQLQSRQRRPSSGTTLNWEALDHYEQLIPAGRRPQTAGRPSPPRPAPSPLIHPPMYLASHLSSSTSPLENRTLYSRVQNMVRLLMATLVQRPIIRSTRLKHVSCSETNGPTNNRPESTQLPRLLDSLFNRISQVGKVSTFHHLMRVGKDLLEEPLSDVSRAYVYGGTDNLRKKKP